MSVTRRNVNNKVKLAGQIAYIRFFDKTATIVVNTGLSDDGKHSNYPKAVVFDKILDVARNFEVGDYVLIEATMQGNVNSKKKNVPQRTIAVNRIIRLNPDNPKYHTANRFDFNGNIIKAEKIDDNKVRAVVAIDAGKINYITVYLESDNANRLDVFCKIPFYKTVYLSGQIRTNRVLTQDDEMKFFDKLIVKNFRVVND